MKREKGIHIILDVYGVEPEKLDDAIFLNHLISKAVSESGLKSFGTLYHKFEPMGYTSVTLLEASHISVHTWPEFRYASIDIFACDRWEKALNAVDIIIQGLKPKRVKKVIKPRGYIYNPQYVEER